MMPHFRVCLYYLATGMDGHANEEDYGLFEASTASEACDKATLAKYPVDEMYGPNNSYSSRDFIRGCLSATLEKVAS